MEVLMNYLSSLRFFTLALALMPCFYQLKASKNVSDVIHLTIDEADEIANIANGTKPAVIKYYADWCGACTMITELYEKLATKFKDTVKFVAVDVTKGGYKGSIPHFDFYDYENNNFSKVGEITGASKELEKIIAAKMPTIRAQAGVTKRPQSPRRTSRTASRKATVEKTVAHNHTKELKVEPKIEVAVKETASKKETVKIEKFHTKKAAIIAKKESKIKKEVVEKA